MASTYTTRVRLEKQTPGENENTWGTILNGNVINLVDDSIAAYTTITVSSVDVTLTQADGSADQARSAFLDITGTLTGSVNVIIPGLSKGYGVRNSTSGSFTVTMKTATGSGIAIPQGQVISVISDGVSVRDVEIAGIKSTANVINVSVGSSFVDIKVPMAVSGTVSIGGGLAVSASSTMAATTFSSNITMNAQSEVRFADADSSHYIAIQAPATVTANVTYTLPRNDGIAGQVLETNGSGTLSFTSFGSPRSYLSGYGMTPVSATAISIAVGQARSDDNTYDITLAAATALSLASTGANALDTGTVTSATWYHVFAISKAEGVSAATLASTNISSPTMPSGYTLKRRIGSIYSDADVSVQNFVQTGDNFNWFTPVVDVSAATVTASAKTLSLSTPFGIKTQALLGINVKVVGTGFNDRVGVYISPLDTADVTVTEPNLGSGTYSLAFDNPPPSSTGARGVIAGSIPPVRTNTSSQVRARSFSSSFPNTLNVSTFGWIDRRGRDD
jgi:hypothetical protein